MQFAGIAETNVRYHSNQRIADQFIAENVFKSTNHKNVAILGLTEMTEVLDTAEILVAGLKKIELQFIAETVLEKMNINQKILVIKNRLGITILMNLMNFILH